MFKLLKYLKKYWYLAILAPIFMIIEVLMDMVLNVYMERMIDYGVQTGNIDNILKYGFIMIGILIVGVAGGILSGVFANLASFKFSNDLRKDVYKKIMSLSYNQTDVFKTGSLVTRVTNDITQVQNMISQAIRGLIRALSFFVLGIVFTVRIASSFGTIILTILLIEIIIMFIFIKLVFPLFKILQSKLDRVNTVVHENVSGARVVKAFSKEPYEYDRFVEANNDYTGVAFKAGVRMSFLMPILMLIIYSCQMIIYYIGGNSIFNAFDTNNTIGMLKVGEISQAVTYIVMICMSMMMLAGMFIFLARSFASAARINEILDAELEIIDGDLDINTLTEKGTIEFKNVSFSYPGFSSTPILNNINAKINKGEIIAVVGATGCGKSTLVNLVTRFYDVTNGELLVDGYNVKDYKQEDLREKIAICLQKSELFKGSVRSNILWGNKNASDEEIKKALDISQASEFVFNNESGLDMEIEEKGTSLSGGQKQRLSIARAIIKKPEILIFDDSTSALDLITEAKLYKGLKEELSDTTIIVVAQRVATAKNADKIIVLDSGTISAFDTHENLMKSSTIYQDIYKSQLKEEM